VNLPEHIYAVIGLRPGDGIVSAARDGENFPLVCLGEQARQGLETIAGSISANGHPVALVRFSAPEVLRTWGES
jgi:hypothetical protein